jgi:hypothetical protein
MEQNLGSSYGHLLPVTRSSDQHVEIVQAYKSTLFEQNSSLMDEFAAK